MRPTSEGDDSTSRIRGGDEAGASTSIAEQTSGGLRSVAVVNAGGWGTALAVMLANRGYDVRLWARRAELAERITAQAENRDYLPDVTVPPTVRVTSDLRTAVCDADVVVVAVIAVAVWLRWQLEHPERKKKLAR